MSSAETYLYLDFQVYFCSNESSRKGIKSFNVFFYDSLVKLTLLCLMKYCSLQQFGSLNYAFFDEFKKGENMSNKR